MFTIYTEAKINSPNIFKTCTYTHAQRDVISFIRLFQLVRLINSKVKGEHGGKRDVCGQECNFF